jgi:protein-S-isoprenylcysteine O-methyltransferase Ste14
MGSADVSGPPADRPGVIAPPPLVYLAGLGLGLLFDWLVPGYELPGGAIRVVGMGLALAGVGLLAWAVVALRRAKTPVNPYKPSSAVVTDGPYRFSRNPIYLADAILYAGLALAFRSAAALALLPVVLAVVRYGVIGREERYLDRTFGDAYRSYKARVRRWL